MFNSFQDLIDECAKQKLPLHLLIIQNEIEVNDTTEDAIRARIKKSLYVMRESIEKSTQDETGRPLPIKEAMGQAKKMNSEPIFLSKELKDAVFHAMAIAEYSSGMGIICTAPTAGSCGVFPATLFKAAEMLKCSDLEIENAFIVGGAIGGIIGNKATLSGSEGGCQAEVGVASAMAAAAITYLQSGDLETIAHAAALTLKNVMGLVCDPVAGLVISPCIKRNAMGTMNAFLASEMALSGVRSIIPPDEVADALASVGKKIPYELKETALGGIANTKTAKSIRKSIFGKSFSLNQKIEKNTE